MFYVLFVSGHYFFNTDLSKSAFSIYYFGELGFLFFYVLCVSWVISFEFDVIFIKLQNLHIIIVFVSAIRPSVILLSLDKNFLFVKVI